jgi:hypothetical protein
MLLLEGALGVRCICWALPWATGARLIQSLPEDLKSCAVLMDLKLGR